MRRAILPILALASLVGCSQSHSDMRRMVEIRTAPSVPAQCVIRQGDTSIAVYSTPAAVPVPYVITRPSVECVNSSGWRGGTVADLSGWNNRVTVPMNRERHTR